jgi:hypothetical protein
MPRYPPDAITDAARTSDTVVFEYFLKKAEKVGQKNAKNTINYGAREATYYQQHELLE